MQKTQLASLSSVAVVMVLGNSMLIPVLPSIRRAFDWTQVEVGLIITAFSLAAGVTIPVAGYLSDRFGRKVVILAALILYGISGSIAGLVPSFFSQPLMPLLMARICQGIGAGGTYQIAMALTGDLFQTKERRAALGYLESANAGGKVIAPLVGAGLGMVNYRAPFFLYGLSALGAAVAVKKAIHKPQVQPQDKSFGSYWSGLMNIVRSKALSMSLCFLAGAVVLFLYFGILSHLSDLFEREHHITGILLGLVIAVPVLGMALTSFFSGRWLMGHPARSLRLAAGTGLSLAATGLVGAYFLHAPIFLLGSIVVMSVGNGLVLPSLNSLVTGAAAASERGMVTSLYGTVRHAGAAGGPPLFGLMVSSQGTTAFALAAALAAVTSAGIFLLVREEQMLVEGKNHQPRREQS